MNSVVAWALISTRAQVQSQIILDPNYLPAYLFVSYDYEKKLIVWEDLIVGRYYKLQIIP